MISLPHSELEVRTPDDVLWPVQYLHVMHLDGEAHASVVPEPPRGSRVMRIQRRDVGGVELEFSTPLCEV